MTSAEANDVTEIQQLIYRYAWAIDHREFALLDTVFAPDANIHYNVIGGSQMPYAQLRDWLGTSLRIFRMTQHGMLNPMVEVSGDRARSRTYGSLVHVQERVDGTQNFVVQYATYFDELARTAAGWRITSRRLDNMWIQGEFLFAPDEIKLFQTPEFGIQGQPAGGPAR